MSLWTRNIVAFSSGIHVFRDGKSSILRHDLSELNSGLVPFAARIDHARNIAGEIAPRASASGIQINFVPRSEIQERRFILDAYVGRFGSYLGHVMSRRQRPTMRRHKLRFFYYVTCTGRFTFDGTAIISIVRLFHSIHEGIRNRWTFRRANARARNAGRMALRWFQILASCQKRIPRELRYLKRSQPFVVCLELIPAHR